MRDLIHQFTEEELQPFDQLILTGTIPEIREALAKPKPQGLDVILSPATISRLRKLRRFAAAFIAGADQIKLIASVADFARPELRDMEAEFRRMLAIRAMEEVMEPEIPFERLKMHADMFLRFNQTDIRRQAVESRAQSARSKPGVPPAPEQAVRS